MDSRCYPFWSSHCFSSLTIPKALDRLAEGLLPVPGAPEPQGYDLHQARLLHLPEGLESSLEVPEEPRALRTQRPAGFLMTQPRVRIPRQGRAFGTLQVVNRLPTNGLMPQLRQVATYYHRNLTVGPQITYGLLLLPVRSPLIG